MTFHCGINTSRRALLGAARTEADASMMRAPEADRSRPACGAPSCPRTRALCPAQKATTDPLLLLQSVESPREKLPDECDGVIPPGSFSDTTFPRCACSTRRNRRLGIVPGLEATATESTSSNKAALKVLRGDSNSTSSPRWDFVQINNRQEMVSFTECEM